MSKELNSMQTIYDESRKKYGDIANVLIETLFL